ncbi:MAG: hypothetical protein SFT81_01280 [Candidatus Caenarcaniphilales bacterium]|nr:hypothetical protein [Candidatus Caenarcaniphilales bacterium]
MSDEITLDAESATRSKNYDAKDHLRHLLKIGHKPDSSVIRELVELYDLQSVLKQILTEDK